MSEDRVGELKFGGDTVVIEPGDAIVGGRSARAASSLLPGLKTPSKFRAIVNAHFRFDPPKTCRRSSGFVGGLVEWLFAFPQRLSVTISNADRLVDRPREELAQAIWQDICKATGVQADLPPWQSCGNAVPHSRLRRNKTPCARGGHGLEKPVSRGRLD